MVDVVSRIFDGRLGWGESCPTQLGVQTVDIVVEQGDYGAPFPAHHRDVGTKAYTPASRNIINAAGSLVLVQAQAQNARVKPLGLLQILGAKKQY